MHEPGRGLFSQFLTSDFFIEKFIKNTPFGLSIVSISGNMFFESEGFFGNVQKYLGKNARSQMVFFRGSQRKAFLEDTGRFSRLLLIVL